MNSVPSLEEIEILTILRQAHEGWNRHHTAHLAAALAFYLAFSLAPVLVIAIALAGLVIGQKHATQEVLGPLSTFVGPSGARFLTNLVNGLSRPAPNILAASVGIVALIFGASGAFAQLQEALNIVFDGRTEALSFARLLVVRFFAFLMVLSIGLLLLAMQIFNALLVSRAALIGPTQGGALANVAVQVVTIIASLIVLGALFAALYHFVPGTTIRWPEALGGGLFTGALFLLGQWGVSLFVAHTPLSTIHGAAAAGLLILTWLYYSSSVVFFGAEFTRAYAQRRRQIDLPGLEA